MIASKPFLIALDKRQGCADFRSKKMLLLVRQRLDHSDRAVDDRADMQRLLLELNLTRLDFRELEEVFENQIEAVALLQDDVETSDGRVGG